VKSLQERLKESESAWENKVHAALTERDEVQKSKQELEEKYTQSTRELSELQQKHVLTQTELDRLRARMDENEKELEQVRTQLNESTHEREQLQTRLTECEKVRDNAQQQVSELSAWKESALQREKAWNAEAKKSETNKQDEVSDERASMCPQIACCMPHTRISVYAPFALTLHRVSLSLCLNFALSHMTCVQPLFF
jgi:chromosome segregation ATPase